MVARPLDSVVALLPSDQKTQWRIFLRYERTGYFCVSMFFVQFSALCSFDHKSGKLLQLRYLFLYVNPKSFRATCWPWSHDLQPRKLQLMWRCQQLLSAFLVKGHLPRVSRQLLMIRVITKWSRGLCTDLLTFALQLRKTPENLN